MEGDANDVHPLEAARRQARQHFAVWARIAGTEAKLSASLSGLHEVKRMDYSTVVKSTGYPAAVIACATLRALGRF
jgi:hypothetical protein